MRPLLCAALALACAASIALQQSRPEEVFEKTDPWTRGEKADLKRAGYESLGPFHFAEGIETVDIEEALGGSRVLWVETAHFKLGSLLGTYVCTPDDHEKEKLRDELARLAKKLPRLRRDSGKLDPWLRLHLYAQRLEDEYADFLARFGLREEEFPAAGAAENALGSGPYLGQPLKFTVLLTAKSSQLARFVKRFLGQDEVGYFRGPLPGGTWFFGTSAENMKGMGAELDSALHALVAEEIAQNLCDALRGGKRSRALWFTHGLGLWYQRRVDERWSVDVPRVSPGNEDDSWRWEPRLAGLVSNGFVASWDEMLAWKDQPALEARHHMTAWSRVSWLLAQEKADLRALLLGLCEPETEATDDAQRKARAVQALAAGFGKSPAELDEAWRKWVLRKYPKR